MKGLTIANRGNRENRRALDFYPTPPPVTQGLIDFLAGIEPLKRKLKIWEPAAGPDRAMSQVFDDNGHFTVSTDIIYGRDFLTCQIPDYSFDGVVTNPPFNLSDKFIIRASELPIKFFAFLLKSQYWHAAKRVPLFRAHPPQYILALTWRPDFLFDQRQPGDRSSPTMDVCWNVWINGGQN